MANDLNLCQFIGRLGRDPEKRFMASGDAVVNFSIAVGWKGKDKEGTEWIRVNAYGKLAEICAEYLAKGSQVYIAGRMTTRKWQDKDGQDRYSTEINADRMQMLGGKSEPKQEPAAPRQASANEYRSAREGKAPPPPDFDDMADDVPWDN
jgi:single-strand DNA-binding protein